MQKYRRNVILLCTIILFVYLPSAFGWQAPASAPALAPNSTATLSTDERTIADRVKVETVTEVTSTLSASFMQGRGTASPGGERAARYIADRFAALNLKPLGGNNSYLQEVKFISKEFKPESNVKVGDATLKFVDDFIVVPTPGGPSNASGELVFAGYGVSSPDVKRDDFAGLDLKGKIVVLIGGKPKDIKDEDWAKVSQPPVVISSLLSRGVAGVILTNFNQGGNTYKDLAKYLTRRSVTLDTGNALPAAGPAILIMSNEAGEKLFAGSNTTLAQVVEKGEKNEPIACVLKQSANINVTLGQTPGVGHNVVAILEGSDPKLKEEAISYSAHYDAFGIGKDGQVYAGAADNALGVGMLVSIAEAFAKGPRPKRSIIFMAVTGEEYGLLGAEYWVAHPTWPLDKLGADINFDGIGTEVYGSVKRVHGFGQDLSTLGKTLQEVVTAMGNEVMPDPFPEENVFYRSDHFSFVKKGIPAIMLLGFPGGDMSAAIARAKKWLETDYHNAGDTVHADWVWEGAQTIATTGMLMGWRIANLDAQPAWLPNSPFQRPSAK